VRKQLTLLRAFLLAEVADLDLRPLPHASGVLPRASLPFLLTITDASFLVPPHSSSSSWPWHSIRIAA